MTFYLKEGLSQLENSPNSLLFYSKVKRNPINSFNKTIITTIKDEIKANNLPAYATNLIHLHPRAPTFYMLPKIHKQQTPVPDHPIVSSISCPTSKIAKFLDAILSPLVEQQPTYIKDSNHAINIFSTFRFQGEHCFLFSMDVKSLYTSISHEDGLIALHHFLDQRLNPEPPTNTLIYGSFYVQKSGVAMGSNLGHSFACLFVSYQEETIFQSYQGPIPELFKRFVDDGIGATSMPRSDLEKFISFVCNFHPALQFEYQISSSCLSFLDIKLQITDNHITNRFSTRKPTHTATFTMILLTTPNASHQSHFLNYFVYDVSAVTMRILRPRLTKCLPSFPNCNYSRNTIQSAINRISKYPKPKLFNQDLSKVLQKNTTCPHLPPTHASNKTYFPSKFQENPT